jgi:hypothetical protein
MFVVSWTFTPWHKAGIGKNSNPTSHQLSRVSCLLSVPVWPAPPTVLVRLEFLATGLIHLPMTKTVLLKTNEGPLLYTLTLVSFRDTGFDGQLWLPGARRQPVYSEPRLAFWSPAPGTRPDSSRPELKVNPESSAEPKCPR